jgi:hypothetical protein
MTHHTLDDDTLRAAMLQVGVCDDGHVHITLKNAAGKPIADASLGAEQAIGTAADIIKAAKEILGEPEACPS